MSPVKPIATPDPRPAGSPAGSASPTAGVPAAPAPVTDQGDASIEPPAAQQEEQSAENAADAHGDVKPGLWQFTTHLLGTAAATAPALRKDAGGITATYTNCIGGENAVPVAFGGQCKLDRNERNGAAISWAMTCAGTHAHAEGVARYHGDTMDATVHSQLPGADGKIMNVTQQVTGRYLGSCLATAALAAPPGMAGAAAKGAAAEAAVKPEAAPGAPAQQSETASLPQKPEVKPDDRRRVRHAFRRTYRHYAYRGYWGGAGGYDRGAGFGGPAPYSNSGD